MRIPSRLFHAESVAFHFLKWSLLFYLFSLSLPAFSNLPLYVVSISGVFSAIWLCVNPRFMHSSITLAMLLFAACGVISTIASTDINRTILLSLSFMPGLMIFFLMSAYFDIRAVHAIYVAFSMITIIIAVSALWTAIFSQSDSPVIWIREMRNPYILVPNDLILLAVLLPFAGVLFYRDPMGVAGMMSFVSIWASLIAILVYRSRGGILVAFISVFILLWQLYSKYAAMLFIASGLMLLVLVDWLLGFGFFHKCMGVWSSRLPAWMVAIDIFFDHPWIGSGPRTYGNLYTLYIQKLSIPEWITMDSRLMPWAHNLYLETLAEQGIIGCVGLAGILGAVFLSALRLRQDRNLEVRVMGGGVFASFSAILIACFFELSFIRHWFVILFFCITSMVVILSDVCGMDTNPGSQ